MIALAVPPATASPVDHADWLELEALRVADRTSSVEDLVAALRRTGSSEELEDQAVQPAIDDRGAETTQPIAETAFAEVEDRAAACGGAYPFSIGFEHIRAQRRARNSLYVFLLLLSTFGSDAGPADINATQLFEEVAGVAMANCLGGSATGVEVYQFGFPRRVGPPGFRNAVDELCRVTKEGGGSKAQPTRADQKDAALDLVAWRPFPDARRSVVMAWGQCATGGNWTEKLTELHPGDWAAAWLIDRPAVVPLRAFFVPHRIHHDRWYVTSAKGGLLFDRCRIAALARPLPAGIRQACAAYSRYVLTEGAS